MRCSLNEAETQSLKAARGAGLAWGLAEEAGKAVRYLLSLGLPGVELLVECLGHIDGKAYAELAPVEAGGRWVGADGSLCAMIAGVAFADHANSIADGTPFETGPVDRPLLAAPFAAAASAIGGCRLTLAWPGVVLEFDGETMRSTASAVELTAPAADWLRCEPAGEATQAPVIPARIGSVEIDDAAWAALGAFAHRTYVPASEASRALGAGAGIDDND